MSQPVVIVNSYGDTQIVGDVSALPLDDALAFLRGVVAAADRGVWLRVPFTEEGVRLIAAAWSLGFTQAHSSRGNVVTLQCWRRAGVNPTPTDAFTDIGATAIVVDSRGRILGVRERFDRTGRWGLPGGHVDSGEGFSAAAVREVWEEAGVRCFAVGCVGQRHLPSLPPMGPPPPGAPPERIAAAHQSSRFGSANLGVFVLCCAVGGGPDGEVPLAVDSGELAEARWLSPSEFCGGAGGAVVALWVAAAEVRRMRGRCGCRCSQPSLCRCCPSSLPQVSGLLCAGAAAAAAAVRGVTAAAPRLAAAGASEPTPGEAALTAALSACPMPPPWVTRDTVVRLAHSSAPGASYEVICTHAFPAGTLRAAAARVGPAILAVEEVGGTQGGAPGPDAEETACSLGSWPRLPSSLRCPVTWVWMGALAVAVGGGAVAAVRLVRRRMYS